jgi:hypothetical protein
MAASCLGMFKSSSINEDEIQKLVVDHLLPPDVVLQWWSSLALQN